MKLLIVDDHAETRSLIREFIGHLATEVYECANGEAAMRHCLDNLPDLITLDLRMGVVDGLAVLTFLRKVCPSVTVIVVTQYADEGLQALVKREGAARCFVKSDLTAVRDYVARWMRQRVDDVDDVERVSA